MGTLFASAKSKCDVTGKSQRESHLQSWNSLHCCSCWLK